MWTNENALSACLQFTTWRLLEGRTVVRLTLQWRNKKLQATNERRLQMMLLLCVFVISEGDDWKLLFCITFLSVLHLTRSAILRRRKGERTKWIANPSSAIIPCHVRLLCWSDLPATIGYTIVIKYAAWWSWLLCQPPGGVNVPLEALRGRCGLVTTELWMDCNVMAADLL